MQEQSFQAHHPRDKQERKAFQVGEIFQILRDFELLEIRITCMCVCMIPIPGFKVHIIPSKW